MSSIFGEGSGQRQRLGRALRDLRKAAGMSGTQLADRLGVSQSTVSRFERGEQIPSLAEVDAWVSATGATDEARTEVVGLIEAAATEAVAFRRTRVRRGLVGQQRDTAAMEASTGVLRSFNPVAVQGLLQTPAYTQAIYQAAHPGRTDLAGVVAARMDRQQVLYAPGKRFFFVLGEPALRWWRSDVMLGQVDRLGQLMTLPNVHIGILPLGGELPVWIGHAFTAFCERANNAEDLVHIETLQTAVNVRDREDVARYLDAHDRLMKASLTGAGARALLERVAGELRGD